MKSITEKRPVILAVSFGTSFGSTRSVTIGAIESTLAESFPDWEVRRAFTSNMIRKKLKERDGILTDSVPEALEKLAAEGVRTVVIQPTHMLEGDEYDKKIVAPAAEFEGRFESLKIGHALLTEDADYEQLAKIVIERCPDPSCTYVYMGHGTEHSANAAYRKLQACIEKAGAGNIFIGTVEAEPTVEDMLAAAQKAGNKKVVLTPLMIVAGDHATNDMAGDDEDSWKNLFKKAGYEVTCRIEGLGSVYEVQKMIAMHCKKTIEY